MNQDLNQTSATDQRLNWIEPEVRQLDVRETAAKPSAGSDGGGGSFPDCTHS